MAETTTVIYRLWHLPTGRCYIGQTSNSFADRFSRHYRSWSKAIDADRSNWFMHPVAELTGVKSQSKNAFEAEQDAIDSFILAFGRDMLLNKSVFARSGIKAMHEHNIALGHPNLKLAQKRLKELGYPGIEAIKKRRADAGNPGAKASEKTCTLFHQAHGICTEKSFAAFARSYACNKSHASAVSRGALHQHKGWRLPIEGQDYCTLPVDKTALS